MVRRMVARAAAADVDDGAGSMALASQDTRNSSTSRPAASRTRARGTASSGSSGSRNTGSPPTTTVITAARGRRRYWRQASRTTATNMVGLSYGYDLGRRTAPPDRPLPRGGLRLQAAPG